MKLLFNTEDKDISSDEIKEHLGYVDADLSFKNLIPDIISSTRDIIKIIGKDIYNHAITIYEDNLSDGVLEYDLDDEELNFLRSIRYSILVQAYRLFAPSNDLAHTSDGRSARVGENNKQAWEWQIEKDNKAQEKRYYRSLDDLINLLDNSKPEGYDDLVNEDKEQTLYYKWINSNNYKELKKNFLNNLDDFNKAFVIESGLLLLKLTPAIEECERTQIIPRMSAEKYTFLKSGGNLSQQDNTIIDLIKKAEAFYAIAWAIPRMSIQLFPEGVLQFQISDRMTMNAAKPAMLNEHELAKQAFTLSYQNTILEIEKLLAPEPVVLPIGETPVIKNDFDDYDSGDKHFSIS